MQKKHRVVFIWIGVFFCFLFRPRYAFSLGGIQDDLCYLNFLYNFFGQVPEQACTYPSTYFPGVSLVWFPAATLAFLFHLILKKPFTEFYLIFIGITSFYLWLLSFFLFSKALTKKINTTEVQNFLWFLNIPVLYFCFQRTTLAHTAELFFACLTFYLIVSKKLYLALASAIALALTRPNDAPILFVVFGALIDQKKKNIRLGILFAALTAPFIYIGFFKGYGKTTFLLNVFREISLFELSRMLFNRYTGFLWAGLSWSAVFILGLLNLRKLSYRAYGVLLWLTLQFLVACGWTTAGGTIYNRYFIGTYLGVFLLYTELHPTLSSSFQKIFKWIFYGNGLYLTYIFWIGTSRFAPFWAFLVDPNLSVLTIAKHQLYSLSLASQGTLGMGMVSLLPRKWLPPSMLTLSIIQLGGLFLLGSAQFYLMKRYLKRSVI